MAGRPSRESWSWKRYERPGLMQDEIEEVKEAFDLFDVDGTQRINPRDLRACVQSLNLRRNQVVHHILNDLERQGGKPLDFGAFLDLMTAKMGERDTKEDVSKVFRLFDDDRTGKISLRNLQRVARELGEQLPVEALEDMIARADADGDGEVTAEAEVVAKLIARTSYKAGERAQFSTETRPQAAGLSSLLGCFSSELQEGLFEEKLRDTGERLLLRETLFCEGMATECLTRDFCDPVVSEVPRGKSGEFRWIKAAEMEVVSLLFQIGVPVPVFWYVPSIRNSHQENRGYAFIGFDPGGWELPYLQSLVQTEPSLGLRLERCRKTNLEASQMAWMGPSDCLELINELARYGAFTPTGLRFYCLIFVIVDITNCITGTNHPMAFLSDTSTTAACDQQAREDGSQDVTEPSKGSENRNSETPIVGNGSTSGSSSSSHGVRGCVLGSGPDSDSSHRTAPIDESSRTEGSEGFQPPVEIPWTNLSALPKKRTFKVLEDKNIYPAPAER
ncbi:Icl1d [Symbiodinium sp. CCMP2592]|nr:Icl1d [Symbiodinium sp. CCMP2592]